ncbi:Thaumatin family protein [Dioscorea alata]|uniref:Thaumatin family protein n=1 Tax=Dioscorea alata TaxID=55571 RepID=A0ACB7UQE0_DIOAL|nr:Thaumatin family protein [Dioscorea alata]
MESIRAACIAVLSLLTLLFEGLQSSTTFTFINQCKYTVWAGTLSGAGSIPLPKTGFELYPNATVVLPATARWSGRFWGRTGCSTDIAGKFSCATGDCASGTMSCSGAGAIPPATLAEITLGTNGSPDFYDISLVDGYNLPMSLIPVGGQGSNCKPAICSQNINRMCPTNLQVNGDGGVVACKSACEAFGDPKYCCTGVYGNPNSCKPTYFSSLFKSACPSAYSYAFDDLTSTFTCVGPSYLLIFCP